MVDRRVVQGTLELLILRTLVFGPLHGTGSPGTSTSRPRTCCRWSTGRSIQPWSGEKQVYHLEVGAG